jgi:predicted transcriptional regulator
VTKLLEEAIVKIRSLSEADQDNTAEALLVFAARAEAPVRLDEATRAAVREGLGQARRGEFATDEHVAALFSLRRSEG